MFFFSDYIMIVCLCFKFHEIYLYNSLHLSFRILLPLYLTLSPIFRPIISAEPRTSCQPPLRRVDARAPCRNGKRTTTHLQLLWKLVDFGLSSQTWWCRVSYVSLSFFYFNIVCLSFLPCLNQNMFWDNEMISVISCEIVWEKEAICGEDFDLKANNIKTIWYYLGSTPRPVTVTTRTIIYFSFSSESL